MRPIHYGIIFFFIGMIGWICFSVIEGIGDGIQQAAGHKSAGSLTGYVYFFGVMFFFSLPLAIIGEIIRWRRNKKAQFIKP